MKHYIRLFTYLIPLFFLSCEDDEISEEVKSRNLWIKDIMEEVYLWEDEIPEGLNPDTASNSKDYFKEFVYKDDYWSWISDDYYETEKLYSGITTTSGCEYNLSLIGDNYTVIGIVEYVLLGSPAEESGIKRGDIFTQINETTLNYDNYYDLLTMGGKYSMTLAKVEDKTLFNVKTVSITEVENFQENPILIDTVFTINGKKIGYLMYTSYLADYIDEVDNVFAQFKAEGITDLIMDLRYNSGGSVAAEVAMANLIAPTSAIGEIFQKSIYNDSYNTYFTNKYGSDYLNTLFIESANNINLSGQLIGLTGPYTASASEGLLNGLDPVTDMTLIGDTTYGKYTAMIVLPDDEDNPEWAIIPIVSKTTNKDNVSVKGGMLPDILLSDDPLDGYQLGDINETFLAKAIELITGEVSTKSATVRPDFMGKKIASIKDGKRIKPYPQIAGWGKDFLIK